MVAELPEEAAVVADDGRGFSEALGETTSSMGAKVIFGSSFSVG